MGQLLSVADYHNKHHKIDGRSIDRVTCRRCAVAGAICATKILYKSRACADKKALADNIERHWWPGGCMLAYRCRHCRLWHLTTANRKRDRERVEKMRLKWLRKTGQKNLEWGEDGEERFRFSR